jgi:hypothetical protein
MLCLKILQQAKAFSTALNTSFHGPLALALKCSSVRIETGLIFLKLKEIERQDSYCSKIKKPVSPGVFS